jgi:lysyl-tRNA synthetase, class II
VTRPEPGAAYPYAFDRTDLVADVRKRHETHDPDTSTGEVVRVAGRIRTVRTHGKVAFADLEDSTGRIQLFAQQEMLGDDGMAAFERLNVGDIVGAEGEVVLTRRGELSVKVATTVVLAPCTRPMPDNWHGIADVETRYRQRYLDFIVNPAARRFIDARAVANDAIRSHLGGRGFVEVETPLLQPVGSGAVARPFVTHYNALDVDLYLRVAPELYLKRLLIGGAERVYELNRSFRNEGISTRHIPEFSMLEAYEAYVDYNETMSLVEDLVRAITDAVVGTLEFSSAGQTLDLAPPFERITLFEAMRRAGGPDLERAWREGDYATVTQAATEHGVKVHPAWAPGKVLAELFELTAERTLVQPLFVTGFPKDVSPLAKDHRTIPGFTEQADLYLGGIEMAPVYSELNDPGEQRRRFEQQARASASGAEETALPDEDFLEALAYGMPPAGGFGLGIDRLLMVLLDAPSIREVILFPILRPSR